MTMSSVNENNVKQLFLRIGGMQCSFCVETITKALKQLEGIKETGVSLAHEQVYVAYDSRTTDELTIKDTLKSLGFPIRDADKVMAMEQERHELVHHRNLVFFSLIGVGIAIVLMFLAWNGIQAEWFSLVMLLTSVVMVFGVGHHILKMAVASLRRKILNQHVLMESGAFGGLLGGLMGFFLSPWPMMDYFAAAIFITAYHLLSEHVAALVRMQSSSAVMKLLSLQPPVARIIDDGENEREIPISEVKKGDIVIVRPGESIPVDGIIVKGQSYVDQSLVTGESVPIFKTRGNEVIGGSINYQGVLFIRTTKVGEESFLSQVSRSIQQARALKPNILLLVEKILKFFVPGVLTAALIAFFVWTVGSFILDGKILVDRAVFSSLSVLVMGYPCALGMATPLAMIRGSGEAARHGILMRTGEAFQSFKDVDVVVLDKTGTITVGKPRVTAIHSFRNDVDEENLLLIAAAIERFSDHPLARTIVTRARQEGLNYEDVEVREFEEIAGKGVTAKIGNDFHSIGSLRFLKERNIPLQAFLEEVIGKDGTVVDTIVGIARNDHLLGFITLGDEIRNEAREAINTLTKHLGMKVILVTGDAIPVARHVAQAVGISDVKAEMLPQEKAQIIRAFQRQGHVVAMVGDGINDAPALTQADVGIAMAMGTDIAIESADIILIKDDLQGIIKAHQIGKKSYHKTKQNVLLAFTFNGIGIPLAVLGFVTPFHAMLAMILSVTTVLLNSYLGLVFPKTSRTWKQQYLKNENPNSLRALELTIPTIHCEKCTENITRVLQGREGIFGLKSFPKDKKIIVYHDSTQISSLDIQNQIILIGHAVETSRDYNIADSAISYEMAD